MIAILRDPVARAWSAYHHEYRRGYETLGFEEALDAEPGRLADAERVLAEGPTRHLSHQHHGYVARGRYAEQLERMWAHVDRDRCLVLYTADLERDPDAVMQRVHDFLGIPARPTAETRRWNRQDTAPISAELQAPAGGGLRAVRRLAGRAPRGATAVADVTGAARRARRGRRRRAARRRTALGKGGALNAIGAVCFAVLRLRARHHHHPLPGRPRRAAPSWYAVAVFSILTRTSVLGADISLVRFVARYRGLGRVASLRPMSWSPSSPWPWSATATAAAVLARGRSARPADRRRRHRGPDRHLPPADGAVHPGRRRST